MTEFEEASCSLHDCLAFLSRWDYRALPDEIIHSALLGTRLLLRYVSTSSGRDLRIYFSAACERRAARCSVFVGSGDGQLFVNDYLARHGEQEDWQLFVNGAPERTTAVFCMDVAAALRRVSESVLADLVQGRPWHFEPFDWAPCK